MQARSRCSWVLSLFGTLFLLVGIGPAVRGDKLPRVLDVEFQPRSAQAKRVAEALGMLGEPLSPEDLAKLNEAIDSTGGEAAIRAIQEVLDRFTLKRLPRGSPFGQ